MSERETLSEYISQVVQKFETSDGSMMYPIEFPFLLEAFAELVMVLRINNLASGDKAPSGAEVLRYNNIHELDGMTLRITFNAFVRWLLDEQFDIDIVDSDSTEYLIEKWNEFIADVWSKGAAS